MSTFQKHDHYQDSGVEWLGEIPAHWDVLPFQKLFEMSAEKNGSEIVGEMLSISGFRGVETKRYESDSQKRTNEQLADYRVVRKGQLAVNTMWLNYAGLGVSDLEGHMSPAYRAYNIKPEIEGRYAHHLLRSSLYVDAYTGLMQGIRPNSLQIKNEDFKKIPILLPPKPEQDRIVAFLDEKTAQIDALIAKKERQIQLLDEQKAIRINQAVTRGLNPKVKLKPSGIEWIGEIPKHWEVVRVGHFARVGNGSTPSRSEPRYWNQPDFPWLNSASVNQGTVTKADQFISKTALRECHLPKVKERSVLVAITGQGKTRGTAALLNIPATINQHLAYIEVQKRSVIPEFIHITLKAQYLQLRAISESGSTKGALTCQDIKEFKLALPPHEEQRAILLYSEKIEMQCAKLSELVDKEIQSLKNLRSSLIAHAVTGRIKV